MEKVEELVDRACHLALHGATKESQPVDSFHISVDAHLQNIYKAAPTLNYFIATTQHESRPQTANDGTNPAPPSSSSLDAFRAYMKGPTSSAQAPASDSDLTAPLSDYFISSSHNTYLTGNQLYSNAAASAYTNVRMPQSIKSSHKNAFDSI